MVFAKPQRVVSRVDAPVEVAKHPVTAAAQRSVVTAEGVRAEHALEGNAALMMRRLAASSLTSSATPITATSPAGRIQRIGIPVDERLATPADGEVQRSDSKIQRRVPAVDRSADSSGMIRREPTSRAEKLKALDKAAEEKRLAHAKDEYSFEKSMKSDDATTAATGTRLAEQRTEVSTQNDVGVLSEEFMTLYKLVPDEAIKQAGFTPNQAATVKARMLEQTSIPTPSELLLPDKIAAHLGKFAKGAHAFIDPSASKKIEGEITDTRFKGWGIDSNFVAPLDEANVLNAKAHKEHGIETVEEELGIPNKNWSKTAWNPGKELVRWVIPKPNLNPSDEQAGVLLKMATGKESGADSKLWVAGGLTKGGASEAVLDAISREDLMKHLASGQIRQRTEVYPETRDNVE